MRTPLTSRHEGSLQAPDRAMGRRGTSDQAWPVVIPDVWAEFFRSIDLCPMAMVVTDPTLPDNPIVRANSAFCALTGYASSEIEGRNCRFLRGPGSEAIASAELRKAMEEQRSAIVEITNYKRDGTPFRNGVMITPLLGPTGKLRWFLGSQVDLGENGSGGLNSRKIDAGHRIDGLTGRQRQVLAGMSHGLLNKQIAGDLNISEKTVQMHRADLLSRLNVRTSVEAIRLAIEAGF